MHTLIKGGNVVTAEGERRADVLVSGEQVAAVGERLDAPAGAQVIDAGGACVMPGGIDPHVHMELPFMGTVSVDDFLSGTACAAAGGTTMIIDFVIPAPQQSLLEAYRTWRDRARKATADYSFHMAVTWWGQQVFEEMGTLCREHGINSFKHFMAYKNAIMVDDATLIASFGRARDLGAICLVHAENGDLVFRMQQDTFERGIRGPEGHPISRPPEVEGEAANRACQIAAMVGVPLYVVHTSCRQAMDAIARAKLAGHRVFGESLVQHLVIDDSVYRDTDWRRAGHHVMSPPFRPADHQQALWGGLQGGTIEVIGTDHCTFRTDQKAMGKDDFRKIPNGTGGLEERMSVLWHHGVRTGRITPSEFVAATSANAARIFNVHPRKGTIAPGSDADIVVWDPAAHRTLGTATHHSRNDFSIFEGMQVTGAAAVTMSRGTVLWKDGRLQPREGHGRYVERPCFTDYARSQTVRNAFFAPAPVERQEFVP
ncbi:MAG: dihydropyrimidinase [Planctomycetes bacterium]|nr:dihydropyrimidinase [Planctomycetota bacterium]